LGELFALSRSTLLYYDSIGLLKPSGRTAAGYRLYSEEDRGRLERIVAFRSLGLPLESIGAYLDASETGPSAMLLRRIFQISAEIEGLREQQRLILDMMEGDGSLKGAKSVLHSLQELGKAAGIDESNYRSLHGLFERSSPEAHRRLLGLLGFTKTDIEDFLENLKDGR